MMKRGKKKSFKFGISPVEVDPVAPHLTVVTSTTAQSGVAGHVSGAHAAWVVSNETAAHETPAAPGTYRKFTSPCAPPQRPPPAATPLSQRFPQPRSACC